MNNQQLLHTTPNFIPLQSLFAHNVFCLFNISPFGRSSHFWTIPTVFLLHLYHFYDDFLIAGPELSPVRVISHHLHNTIISGLTFIPYTLTQPTGWLSAIAWQSTGQQRPMLSKCLFPVFMLIKLPSDLSYIILMFQSTWYPQI